MRKDLFLYHLTSAEMFAKIWHKYFMLQKVFQQACFLIVAGEDISKYAGVKGHGILC